MFKLTDEQQASFLQRRIQKKLRRQEARKNALDERSSTVAQQMSKTTAEIQKLAQKLNGQEEEEKLDAGRIEVEAQNRGKFSQGLIVKPF